MADPTSQADLRALYQRVVLEHNRSPRNRVTLPDATHRGEGHNPNCGDHLHVTVRVVAGAVEAVGFTGNGCAIATASASTMTEAAIGLSAAQVERLARELEQLIAGELEPDEVSQPALAGFAGVRLFPVRTRCATLPWVALTHALAGRADVASTEGLDPAPGQRR